MCVDVVIPTVGRASLQDLLQSLASSSGPPPAHVWIVDDRRKIGQPLPIDGVDAAFWARCRVLTGRAHGPGAARNCGWRASRAQWIAFLDDDVIVSRTWLDDLHRDLHPAGEPVDASQGRLHVPLPANRAATDWERNVGALQSARWITADMAYRREILARLNGFDERFRRAYREDADLALRALDAGGRIACGVRRSTHPVRESDRWISVRLQAGNADDVLMRKLHGRDWRRRAGERNGRIGAHLATVTLAASACGFALLRRNRAALAASVAWVALTGAFACLRIAPGPRTRNEIATMLLTSVAIPFAAVYHRARGSFS